MNKKNNLSSVGKSISPKSKKTNLTNKEKKNLEEIVQKIWGMPIEKAYKKLPDEMNHLQPEEKLAIRFYTHKGDRITNPYLRDGKPDAKGITKKQADLYAETLSKSLGKLPDEAGTFYRRVPFNSTTYKIKLFIKLLTKYVKAIILKQPYPDKTSFEEAVLKNENDKIKLLTGYREAIAEKKPYPDEAFFSTSTNSSVLRKRSTDIGIIIRGKRGKSIEKISRYPREREILFDKKTSFRIISVKRGEVFLPAYKHIQFIVEMEEI